jgi:hypothetical protein
MHGATLKKKHQLLSDIPNSSSTPKKMGIKCSSTSATNMLQEKL